VENEETVKEYWSVFAEGQKEDSELPKKLADGQHSLLFHENIGSQLNQIGGRKASGIFGILEEKLRHRLGRFSYCRFVMRKCLNPGERWSVASGSLE